MVAYYSYSQYQHPAGLQTNPFPLRPPAERGLNLTVVPENKKALVRERVNVY
jgi:hypothetical protein